jgi:tRNA-dihydrouridine synthase 3
MLRSELVTFGIQSKTVMMDSQETVKRPQEEVNRASNGNANGSNGEPAPKRMRLEDPSPASQNGVKATPRPRVKGVAPIKPE